MRQCLFRAPALREEQLRGTSPRSKRAVAAEVIAAAAEAMAETEVTGAGLVGAAPAAAAQAMVE